jgi:hypothetical protein
MEEVCGKVLKEISGLKREREREYVTGRWRKLVRNFTNIILHIG